MSNLPFHIEFQSTCLAQLWRNNRTLTSFGPTFQSSFLEDPTSSHLCAIILDYFKSYGKSPSKEVVFELIRKSYPEVNNEKHIAERRMLEKRLDEIAAIDISDEKFTQTRIGQFISWRAIIQELKGAIDSVKTGEFDPDLVSKFANAIKSGEVKVEFGVSGRKDVAEILRKEVDPKNRPRVPTGITHLDQETGGGPRGGELWAFLAPPKGFKSGTLLNIAFGGLLKGTEKNVLYLTLELSEELQALRFAIRTTMKEKERLFENPEDYIQTYLDRFDIVMGEKNDLMIKYMAPYACTPRKIREFLDSARLDLGIEFGLICVDYLDLMGSDSAKEKDYLEKVQICTDLRAIAVDYDIPIVTACRATREATGKKRINMSHMAGAFERVAICDYVAALCLHRDQGVVTQEGITKIVNIRTRMKRGLETQVLSHNFSTGVDEWKPVVRWFNNGTARDGFVKLKFDNARTMSKTSTTTAGHFFFRPDGSEVRARDLEVGSEVLGSEYKLTPDQLQVVLGTVLGDGHIRRDGTLAIEHHTHQNYYIQWKQGVFSNLPNSLTPITRKESVRDGVKWKERTSDFLTVRGSIEIKRLRDTFYNGKTKFVPNEVLNQVNELGLAVWFADDGSFRKDSDRVALYTNGFSDADRALLVDWFDRRWSLTCKPRENGALDFDAPSSRRIELIVSAYLVRQYDVNTGETKKFLCPAIETGSVVPSSVRVVEKSIVQRRNRELCDMEVADNHNYYLANGVLVHNCQTDQERVDGIIRIVPVAVRNESGDKQIICEFKPSLMAMYSTEARELTDEDFEDEDGKGGGGGGKKHQNSGKKQMENEDDEAVEKGTRRLKQMRDRKSPRRSVASELSDDDEI